MNYSLSVLVYVRVPPWLQPLYRLYLLNHYLSITRRMAIANGTCVSFNLATSGESRRYVVAFTRFASRGTWLPQESLRHILASPGYAPGTLAVNVTWIKRGFNTCQTHCSMYLSIFNRLRAIARYWSEIATFSYPLHLTPPLGVFPLEFWETFGPQKTIIMGLPGSENSLTIGWAVPTQYQRVTDRRTDRQTDVQRIAITRAVWLTHVRNDRIF